MRHLPLSSDATIISHILSSLIRTVLSSQYLLISSVDFIIVSMWILRRGLLIYCVTFWDLIILSWLFNFLHLLCYNLFLILWPNSCLDISMVPSLRCADGLSFSPISVLWDPPPPSVSGFFLFSGTVRELFSTALSSCALLHWMPMWNPWLSTFLVCVPSSEEPLLSCVLEGRWIS